MSPELYLIRQRYVLIPFIAEYVLLPHQRCLLEEQKFVVENMSVVDVIDYMNIHLTPDEREQIDVIQGPREKTRKFINIMALKNDPGTFQCLIHALEDTGSEHVVSRLQEKMTGIQRG